MSWQETLWSLPSELGWRWYAALGLLAAFAALSIFAVAIYGQRMSGMLAARVAFCLGLVLIPLSAVNSGWQPWIPFFYTVAGLIGTLSMTIARCGEETGMTTVGAALVEKLHRAVALFKPKVKL